MYQIKCEKCGAKGMTAIDANADEGALLRCGRCSNEQGFNPWEKGGEAFAFYLRVLAEFNTEEHAWTLAWA